MAIILDRDTGFVGSLLKFKVEINNEDIGKIAQGEKKEFMLPEENSVLQVKQLGSKSNKLVVNDEDYIEISNAPWLLWGILTLIILGTIMGSFDGIVGFISLTFVVVCYLIFIYFVDSFKLNKKNRE